MVPIRLESDHERWGSARKELDNYYIDYTTDIMVSKIYTKRYTYLGKGAIVQGFASHYI